MRKLVTGKQMKEIDAHAIREIGIPSLVLMERAALAAVSETERELKARGQELTLGSRVAVIVGSGNNGADGAAMARMWHLRGMSVTLVAVGNPDHRTEEMNTQLRILGKLGVFPVPWEDFAASGKCADDFALAVDALFGVGLSREVGGNYAAAVDWLNRRERAFVTAVDIPSGVDSATGAILGTAVRAEITVTFGFEKLGTFLFPGRSAAGKTVVRDIGFPDDDTFAGTPCFAMGPEDLLRVPKRKPDSHKGSYGRILIAAGSAGMCGAAYFSALAAYRTGAGLVKILTERENLPILQQLLPEALISAYDPEICVDEPEDFRDRIEKECAWADAIVLGPGLGKGRHVEKLAESIFLAAYVPIIVDADGLNAIAEYPHLMEFFTENVIVTPHIGEMSRLTGLDPEEIKADPVAAARNLSDEKGIICVLKDAVTVIARHDGKTVLSDSGSSAMAKGGSGDVLTGVIAALTALGLSEDDAACLGVYIHGRAGRMAGEARGEHSILAREITDYLMR